MDEELKIVNLIDVDMINHMLSMMTELTGMVVQCADENGTVIAGKENFSDFCGNNIRCSKVGGILCEQCIIYATQKAAEVKNTELYLCHCGLINLAAPIMVEGKIIGSLVAGQVLLKPFREEHVRSEAMSLGLNEEKLVEAAQKIPIKNREEVEHVVVQLYTQASILSEIAYGRYLASRASVQIESTNNVKSDFLANMSHEIRTPMNAVIGMAEMALREEMTPAARDYIGQIKSSGKALLNIINDILDFSKIESGKMELSCVDYEPLSLINDVSLIIMTRLTDKPVELLVDVDPDIPHTLYGDDLRIRQVLINLANNATKFTNQGHVMLKVRYNRLDEDNINLLISVIDTGIGIRKEDMGKLFSSFQQVDSKRNRNVEGTGLGLAISKNLISLMNGHIYIESEYEVGSTFTLEIPQKIVENRPSIKLASPEKYALAGFFSRDDVAEDFVADARKLKVYADDLSSSIDPQEAISAWLKLHSNQQTYILVDEKVLESTFKEYFSTHLDSEARALLLAESFSDVKQWEDMPYMQIIKKPFSVLGLASFLEADSCEFGTASNNNLAETEFNFVAPKARILVVDDNAINLSVAEGLLEPLKMQVNTARSGKEAIEMIDSNIYDLIFMDHMMPDMDGVETTRIIRRMYPKYEKVPIIALTANAISGTREMFLAEGMNDFVAKPIEVRVLISKVHQWLPDDKIQQINKSDDVGITDKDSLGSENGARSEKVPKIPTSIGDLDIRAAFSLLGSEKLFWKVYKDYYRVITAKADLIEHHFENKDWTNYVVEVHALKSASKQIGAEALSKLAAELENAGNNGNIGMIEKHTAEMVEKYRSYIPLLAPYCAEKADDELKELISEEKLKELFGYMLEALDNLDSTEMEKIVGQMDAYRFEDTCRDKFDKLKTAVSDIDIDTCEELINTWFE